MIDQHSRITNIVKDTISQKAPVDKGLFGWAVTQLFAPLPGPNGQIGLGPAWFVTVSIKSKLLGYPDVAVAFPVPGLMPKDNDLRTVTGQLVDNVRAGAAEQLSAWEASNPERGSQS